MSSDPIVEWTCNTPVAFFVFNRPRLTQRVFEVIRQVRPTTLLIVADGARSNRSGEQENCAAVRAIVEKIDWKCEVLKNYSEVNLGCKMRVSSGLDWVFSTVNQAIILEDDCLPHPTFFYFCQELLSHYRNDSRIMSISGNNFQFGRRRTQDSYYFSRYHHIWGWATWKRAWQYYDVDMKQWPKVREQGWLVDILGDRQAARIWSKKIQATYEGKIDTWDYQLTLSFWLEGGLSIIPNVNLVSNMGVGTDATHPQSVLEVGSVPAEEMKFPLQHPSFKVIDSQADRFTEKKFYGSALSNRIKSKLREVFQYSFGTVFNALKE